MAAETLSAEDQEFLSKCEEYLKDRYTDKDEEFMKIFNSDPSTPPIIESWWVPEDSGRKYGRRNRRSHPYRERSYQDRRDNYDRRNHQDRRGYNDYNRGDRPDGGYGYNNRNQRSRYY